jgi:hypothetical protein
MLYRSKRTTGGQMLGQVANHGFDLIAMKNPARALASQLWRSGSAFFAVRTALHLAWLAFLTGGYLLNATRLI